MPWWVLELIATGVLVAVVLLLGPLIKRYGKSYAADIFVANPRTGKSYLVLMDVAYYLIFGAFILLTATFEAPTNWGEDVVAEQLKHETARLAGLMLLMGLLHGLNVITLPVIGRLLSLNRRLDEDIESRTA
ncbi:MAG TPA: hypothetical protein VLG28_18575 [Acidimicrobiia bacterium]|jgi:hypothetical protein|nr:hypothetical protein [Acidimicrobiia bacterium]